MSMNKTMMVLFVLTAIFVVGCSNTDKGTTITVDDCNIKNGRIVDTLEGDTCSSGEVNIGNVEGLKCPCICCSRTEQSAMTAAQALAIAKQSSCVNEGQLKETMIYNENSKTWWIDMDADRPGCAPACVVSADGGAEINWRCTGLIPEQPQPMTQQLCESAGGRWNECGNTCQLLHQGQEGIACTLECQQLCECGGIAGFGCPAGYDCVVPEGIADAMGFCAAG